MTNNAASGQSAELAGFVSRLVPQDIPDHVYERITGLFVDWAGSCFSGNGHKAVEIIADFAIQMNPDSGPSEILTRPGTHTSPYFASMANAAASHISEQDDVHNGSVFHPATVVFPSALAVAQAIGASGRDFLTACVAGYEAGIRAGEALGLSHYRVFHTTGTAGTFASAVAVGHLLKLDPEAMLNAIGSAGTQSAGLWEFLRDGADSKQLHTAKSASGGLLAAYLAKDGFTGAKAIMEGPQGLAAGTSSDFDVSRITDRLGERWGVLETSFKFHASCRHTHPAADALLSAMTENSLSAKDISHVTCHVHQAAIDVLGPVHNPASVHQAKFCMAATLGLIATHGSAGLMEFEQVLEDETALSFLDRIVMEHDAEVEAIYPERWVGKVTLETIDGRTIHARVDEPKGDPGNTLSQGEIDRKARMLIRAGGAVPDSSTDALMHRLWNISDNAAIGDLASPGRHGVAA